MFETDRLETKNGTTVCAVGLLCIYVCVFARYLVQLMPLPSQNPIISCLIYIQTGFTSLVLAYPGCPGKEAVKRV